MIILKTISQQLMTEPRFNESAVGLSSVIADVKLMINGGSCKGALVEDSPQKLHSRDCFYQPSKCRSAFESLLVIMKRLDIPNIMNERNNEGSLFSMIIDVSKKVSPAILMMF